MCHSCTSYETMASISVYQRLFNPALALAFLMNHITRWRQKPLFQIDTSLHAGQNSALMLLRDGFFKSLLWSLLHLASKTPTAERISWDVEQAGGLRFVLTWSAPFSLRRYSSSLSPAMPGQVSQNKRPQLKLYPNWSLHHQYAPSYCKNQCITSGNKRP